jgi:hypothetical protein
MADTGRGASGHAAALRMPENALAFDEGRATKDDDEAFALRGDEGVESCAGGGLA